MSPHKPIFLLKTGRPYKVALSADKTTVIEGADKGSSGVVWDSSEYLHEASTLLQDQNIDVKFNTKMLNSIKTY